MNSNRRVAKERGASMVNLIMNIVVFCYLGIAIVAMIRFWQVGIREAVVEDEYFMEFVKENGLGATIILAIIGGFFFGLIWPVYFIWIGVERYYKHVQLQSPKLRKKRIAAIEKDLEL